MAVMYCGDPHAEPLIYSLRNRDMKKSPGKSLLEKENIFLSKMVTPPDFYTINSVL